MQNDYCLVSRTVKGASAVPDARPRRRMFVLVLLLLNSAWATAAELAGLTLRTIEPEMSEELLFNPGMRLYLAGGSGLRYQPAADAWALSLCDIVYFRPDWNDLEADGPGAGFDTYFDPIFDFWVKQRGKRVAFRVMSESMHSPSKRNVRDFIGNRRRPSGVRTRRQRNVHSHNSLN